MLSSAFSALNDRLDSKFLTAYVLPAFVAVLGGFGLLAALAGLEHVTAWVYDLDSVKQSLAVIILVGTIVMVAFLLRALTRPVAILFVGSALPGPVAAWSTRRQRRSRDLLERNGKKRSVEPAYPRDPDEIQPTLLGNVLAAATDYPRLVYAMDGAFWWPRLTPLLPGSFQDSLGAAQAPMMGLLNLSVVFATLAFAALAVLGVAASHWTIAFVLFVAGLAASRLCYQGAAGQALELSSLIRVAFDLYRHEILAQMELAIPADLATERALWQHMSDELHTLEGTPGTASSRQGAAT